MQNKNILHPKFFILFQIYIAVFLNLILFIFFAAPVSAPESEALLPCHPSKKPHLRSIHHNNPAPIWKTPQCSLQHGSLGLRNVCSGLSDTEHLLLCSLPTTTLAKPMKPGWVSISSRKQLVPPPIHMCGISTLKALTKLPQARKMAAGTLRWRTPKQQRWQATDSGFVNGNHWCYGGLLWHESILTGPYLFRC